MRALTLLPLAALGTAFVVPDAAVFSELAVERQKPLSGGGSLAHAWDDAVDRMHHFLDGKTLIGIIHEGAKQADRVVDYTAHRASEAVDHTVHRAGEAVDDAVAWARGRGSQAWDEGYFDAATWLGTEGDEEPAPGRERPPHHGPPHDGPHHGRPPHHKPPHRCHPPSNQTIYQLISASKYTTKLAALLAPHADLIAVLNSTAANYTLFAPTDTALSHLPAHPNATKAQLAALLSYHIAPTTWRAGRILGARTIPTLLNSSALGDHPQRIATSLGLFKGLTLNTYAHVVAVDMFAANGVIHALDALLAPPPPLTAILDLLPGSFSTFNLGLAKTGLADRLNGTTGATLFAPTNWAFRKLGPAANAFLFSPRGLPWLEKLLSYHVALGRTLYSDAYYEGHEEVEVPGRGRFHAELPTLLDGRALSIDIRRWGRWVDMRVNAFMGVAVADGAAKEGVLHTVGSVIVPPREGAEDEVWDGEREMGVDELMERLGGVDAVEMDL